MQLNWPKPSEFPTLSAGEVHVWAVPLEAVAETLSTLSPEELARADGFAIEKPRHVYAASRAALRQLLGRYLGESPRDVAIDIDANGKPRLSVSDLQFNLAHSGDLTLIALTRGSEIGVDLERLRQVERSLEIAARNFHAVELAAVRVAAEAEVPEVFLRCWTRKEAVLKAHGAGLAYPLDAFDTLTPSENASGVLLPAHASHLAVTTWVEDVRPCREYLAAVATLESRQPPLGFTYSL